MSSRQIRGVLFDKDGTLFDFATTWGGFCDKMLEALAGQNEELKGRLAHAVGYHQPTRSFQTGSLIVNASAAEVDAAWADLLDNFLLADVEALTRIELGKLSQKTVCSISDVMTALRSQGLKIGVATNDYEIGALRQLADADALNLFDFVCGSDSGFGRKPGDGMIKGFCKKTGLKPEEIAFVGDSNHDMECGINGGVALRVGVLTGPATNDELKDLASVVLNSIEDLPPYLLRHNESHS